MSSACTCHINPDNCYWCKLQNIKKELELIIKSSATEFQMSEEEVRKWVIAELKYLTKFK